MLSREQILSTVRAIHRNNDGDIDLIVEYLDGALDGWEDQRPGKADGWIWEEVPKDRLRDINEKQG